MCGSEELWAPAFQGRCRGADKFRETGDLHMPSSLSGSALCACTTCCAQTARAVRCARGAGRPPRRRSNADLASLSGGSPRGCAACLVLGVACGHCCGSPTDGVHPLTQLIVWAFLRPGAHTTPDCSWGQASLEGLFQGVTLCGPNVRTKAGAIFLFGATISARFGDAMSDP